MSQEWLRVLRQNNIGTARWIKFKLSGNIEKHVEENLKILYASNLPNGVCNVSGVAKSIKTTILEQLGGLNLNFQEILRSTLKKILRYYMHQICQNGVCNVSGVAFQIPARSIDIGGSWRGRCWETLGVEESG